MISNFDLVSKRLDSYVCFPDRKFRGTSDLPSLEKDVEQKIRQYWADESISNEEKLADFDIDLSTFDPRSTSNLKMRVLCQQLYDKGLVDGSSLGFLDAINTEHNSLGNEINKDRPTNIIAHFDLCLAFYKQKIAEGYDDVKDVQSSLMTAISVLRALQERAQMDSDKSLIDIHA
ncbi:MULTISPECIES: hypothetical protein [unclassified Pseudomonas]|uniref:hypothetical protein n=1 Tax=unclassified Pseudomonas TaxID=196821 RepID=UPI002AC8EA1E|nr:MULTISPECIES: hypothetical protein [unclassified Pseudomonas]MEB0042739.1 hypothetical protein [Pseudomonas sp. MH10]MEB0079901.1 hypothetical protein [Pseudomonas sp. MH10out]MEB0093798.1 hypothetical protein [Pseudomonas sp. CCI4.2]MEB0103509.1 hypothetical protein [Pseudomonas sp. CCI3.2]MEB0121662.1 hypothetical protein [Pseudomonas sp. CCI1.2]